MDAASIGSGQKLKAGTSGWGKRKGEKSGIDARGVVNVDPGRRTMATSGG
jgi:hypothetical protein